LEALHARRAFSNHAVHAKAIRADGAARKLARRVDTLE